MIKEKGNLELAEQMFVKDPKKGEIVKIHYGRSGSRYGKVIGLSKAEYYKRKGTLLVIQQTVVLDEIKEVEFCDIDFFFEPEKIEFNSVLESEWDYKFFNEYNNLMCVCRDAIEMEARKSKYDSKHVYYRVVPTPKVTQ